MIPTALPWVNVAGLRMDQQKGRPVLIEFNDLLRPSSLRTSAYLSRWHERYGGDDRLRVITVFSPWLPFSAGEEVARDLVARAGIEHPVLLDLEHRLWRIYENEGWPSRYLLGRDLKLIDFHRGEGGYEQTELAIQDALGEAGLPLTDALHRIDAPEARIVVPSEDRDGLWSGPYEAGEAWAVLSGAGTLEVNGEPREISSPGPELLLAHETHTHGVIELSAGPGLTCHAVCFSPGVAPAPTELPAEA